MRGLKRRLAGLGWALVRAGLLAPPEWADFAPRRLVLLARLLSPLANRRGRTGERLAHLLEAQGPVAIKLGQLMSTRGDILGPQMAEDLSRLKDRLDPFPTEIARRDVAMALGRPLETVFARFDDPIHAASLAQAHPAALVDGRAVAVKVLRPGVEGAVARDIEAMMDIARRLETWSPEVRRLEPVRLAETVARALRLELDLRFEAAGADEMAEVMAADGYMIAPKVVWDGVARRVLTLEWAQGLPLSNPAALAQPGLDRRRLAERLVRAFLAQALDHGVFHADLHEGNLFVDAAGRITAVDFGIIGRLGEPERRYLAEILWGFINRDYRRIARVHFEAGYVPAEQDEAAFAQALRAVGEPLFGRNASEVAMGLVLTQLFDITALFDMRLRPELVLLQKTMVTVEGVARRIDPRLDIWTAAEPVVRRWISRALPLGRTAASWLARIGSRAAS